MYYSVWDLQEQEKKLDRLLDHKHVLVNGKCVNIPSYRIKAGDVVEIKEKQKDNRRDTKIS